MSRGIPTLALLLTLLLSATAGGAEGSLGLPSFDTTAETTYRQIGWGDFKGHSGTPPRHASGGNWAHIATSLRIGGLRPKSIQVADDLWRCKASELQVHAVMDKLLSFVGPGPKTKALLSHEQAHFDLTESASRRLRASLLSVVGEGDNEAGARFDLERQVNNAHRKALRDIDQLHKTYDQETRHGLIKRAQKAWRKKAAGMLEKATAELAEARRELTSREE